MSDEPLIRIEGVTKVYDMGVEKVHALRGVDLEIQPNEYVAIMGSSGSGKSTLLNILGLLDVPTAGKYVLDGKDVAKISQSAQSQVRGRKIGFVFQTFELLPRQTSLRNVELPLVYTRVNNRRQRAKDAMARVGLADRMYHRPNQMSGGQRQRVAIARALAQHPSLLLADEPTGNLDSTTGAEIMELFQTLHDEGQTIIIVTHEKEVAGHCDRIVSIRDGMIESDQRSARKDAGATS